VAAEEREAALPGVVGEEVAGSVGLRGIGMPVEDLADAAYVAVSGVLREEGCGVGLFELGVRDDGLGEAAAVGERLQPARFGEGVGGAGAGLDVNYLGGAQPAVMGADVAEVVVQEIVAGEGTDIAGDACGQGWGEPGIGDTREVPQVHVGVDYG